MKLMTSKRLDSRATIPLCQCYSPIEPAGQGTVQTVQAGAGEAGGEEGVQRDEAGEEGAAAGRQDPPTATIETGRTWVGVGLSRWAEPEAAGRKQANTVLLEGQKESNEVSREWRSHSLGEGRCRQDSAAH